MSAAEARTEAAQARRGRHFALAAAILALYAFALYARLLLGQRVLAEGDLLLYFAPYRDYAAEALRGGRIPFWNPYLFAGAPFLANPQAAVLYPLHWPLAWLSAHQQIVWSAAIHVWILGLGGYLLVRRIGGEWPATLAAALLLQGSGFVGGLIGHLNQLNGVAWLPWLLLLATPPQEGWTRRSNLLDALWLALVVALMLLAGHTQTTYINLVGAGLWLLLLGVRSVRRARRAAVGSAAVGSATVDSVAVRPHWWTGLDDAGLLVARFAGACLLGALLAMPQLLPMLELSGRGLRSGGLSYAEATSFSLQPTKLLWSLLPSYGLARLSTHFGMPAWSEFLAWVGLIGLALAVVALLAWRKRGTHVQAGVGLLTAGGALLALSGFLLALGRWNPLYWLLYQVVPGFDLFRTPARWMMLYTLGLALLAAAGVAALRSRPRTRTLALLLPFLLALELLVASLALPSAHATAPIAFDAVRTAPAQLLSAPERMAAIQAGLDPAAASRFLGMSTITYDPGDLADLQRIYRDPQAPQLSQQAFDALIVALKVQELLVPNLPLTQRVAALDGYDGGLLPVNRYMLLASLLAPAEELVPDGRLREQIERVPPAALLALLDVQHVVTDKVRDLWFENVFYDRQIGATLHAADAPLAVDAAPAFPATHVDLIAVVQPAAGQLSALPADSALPVLQVTVESAQGSEALKVTAGGAPGAQLADGALDSPLAAASGAIVALRDEEGGRQLYRVRLPLASPTTPTQLLLQATNPAFDVLVEAATLVDARSGMFQALLPSDRGPFHLVHSGDVKVYENLAPTLRATLITDVRRAASPAEALATLRTLDAETQVVVEGDVPTPLLEPPYDATASAPAAPELVAYAPERVELRTASERPALLLLRDAWDPGWSATVDGQPAPVLVADVHFRGVALEAGSHTVVFRYRAPGWRLGCGLAALGVLIWLLLAALASTRAWRRIAQSEPHRPAL